MKVPVRAMEPFRGSSRNSVRGSLRKVLRNAWSLTAVLLLPAALLFAAESRVVILEDFSSKDQQGFPSGWEAQSSLAKAQQAYTVHSDAAETFLGARHARQRVFKRIAWDPHTLPIVSWKWRLKAPPPKEADTIAAVYVSLDTDLFVIPVATKYVWSVNKPKGATTDGGIFGASEIVLRNGTSPVGEWVEERVNAYEDFKRLHQHEPAQQAWGISLLGGSEVEVDFGPISVSGP